ncbi:MAG: pyridoxamine 5'-phosphate oxidase family protein [Spirochaetota bacterium]
MTRNEIMSELGLLLTDVNAGILATTDKAGNPHMRWMTPAILKDRAGVIFAVTSPKFNKSIQLQNNRHVEWMFQTPLLDKIILIKGRVNLLDNSSIKAEVLEAIGPRLTVFWKLNEDERNLIVLETVIEEATYFLPMKSRKIRVSFT